MLKVVSCMKEKFNKLKSNKMAFATSIFVVLLIAISLGSAILSSTLNIGGKAKIKENSWIIYFDDIRDVSASQHYDERATIVDLAKTRIEFDADLKEPGDYYEFYVDTVNDGTIDAAIDSIELPEFTEEQKKYLELRVIDTSTNLDLKRCDTLLAGERKEVKAVLTFKEGLPLEDYPKEDLHLNLFFVIHYAQHPIDGCNTTPKPKKNKLYVIPNGGIYNNRTTPTRIPLGKDEEYTTEIPTRKLYNFDGWEVVKPNGEGDYDVVELTGEEDFEFNPIDNNTKGKYLFKMGDKDTYIRAKWIENDYVARIEDTYYTTIQAAFDSVDGNNPKTGRKWTDNTVWLLRDTTEYPTNNAHDAFTFNLDAHTVTGSITNAKGSNITMVNGRVETQVIEDYDNKINDKNYTFTEDELKDLYAFKNYGIANIGVDEGLVEVENSIALVGNQAGLYNYEDMEDESKSAVFNFYDGYLEGLAGLVGEYDDTPENYYVFSEYRNDTNRTRVYLIRNPSRAVAKTYANNVIYHYNLQSAINALTTHQNAYGKNREKDYKVDAIRNFEAAYELHVGQTTKIVFDLVDYTVQTGEKVTNEGDLKILNSKENHSEIKPSVTIENKGKLEINNVDLTVTTDSDVVLNSGELILSKTTIVGKDSYGVKNTNHGTISMDKDTVLKSDDKCGLYNTGDRLVVNSGKIYCFLNEGTATSTGDPEYYLFKTKTQPNNNTINYMAAIRNSGTLNFDNGSVTTDVNTNMIVNSGTFNFNDGLIHSDYLAVSNSGTFNANGSELSSTRTPINGGTINVQGGDVKSETAPAITSATINVKEGTVYTLDGEAITGPCNVTVSGGTVRGTTYAIHYRGNYYSTSVTVTGGLVEAPVAIDVDNTTIKGGVVKGEENAVITTNYTMTGGKVISTEGIGTTIYNVGNITGGEIYGSTYGVLSKNELTLGTDDGEISSTSPMLLGELYGLYIEGETTNFFDGILKGETDGYYGPITGTPLGGVVFEGDEYILKDENGNYNHSEEGVEGAEFYNTDFISAYKPWLRIGETTYNTLNAASTAISAGDTATIYVIDDADILFAQKILDENKDKHITLDLNGHKVSTTQIITNYSNLTITDSSKGDNPQDDAGTSDGELKFIKNVGFINEQELILEDGKFVSTVSGLFVNNKDMIINGGVINAKDVGIDNNSSLVINGGKIEKSVTGVESSYGTVEMNGGYIYSTSVGVANGAFTMNGGEIYSKNHGVSGSYYQSGSVVLNDGKITAETGYAAQRTWFNNITVNGGEYTSLNNIGIQCDYNIYIYGGTIKGTTGVQDGAFSDGVWLHYGDTYIDGPDVKIYGTTTYGVNVRYGTLFDTEGYVQGKVDGIYTDSAIIQLGNNDGSITKEKPVVVGDRYGVNNVKGTFRFFDGIIKGKASTSEANDGHHGIVTLIPDGAMVKDDDFEYINRVEYDVEYLDRIGDWLQLSDGSTYNSINAAYAAAKDTDTMTVIRSVHVAFEQSMPSGKNITFDENGHTVTMTQPIYIGCSTRFIDSGDSGLLHNIRTTTISNSGTMRVDSGNYTTDYGYALESGGTLTINDGYYYSKDGQTIHNTGTLYFEGGDIQSENNYGVYNEGTFTMNHGEIKTYGAINNTGTFTIKNNARVEGTTTHPISSMGTVNVEDEAEVYSEVTNAITASCGRININGGTTESTVTNSITIGYAYRCGTAHLYMTDGEVIGKTNGIVHTSDGNYINISGGHVLGQENNGLNIYGTLDITGGVVEGNVYGVYVSGGTTTIGEDDGSISIAEPVLKGELYGLYITNPQQMTVNFYDGILKGQTWGHYNDVTNIPDRSNIVYGTETIDEKLYQTAYLYQEGDIARNKRTLKIYDNLQDALDEAEDNDTVELINDVPLFYQVINNSNLTLDLNGHSISTNKNITNNGDLKIVNSKNKKSTIQTSLTTNLITNTNKLEVENVTLRNVSASYYVIDSTGEVKLNNATIESIYGVSCNNKLDIKNSTIRATQTAINNTGELTISGGNYSGGSYSVYSNTSKPVTITGIPVIDSNTGYTKNSNTILSGTVYTAGNTTNNITGVYINGNYQNASTTSNMENTLVTGSVSNNGGTLNMNHDIVSRAISNSANANLDNCIINGAVGDWSTNTGTMVVNDSTFNMNSSQSRCSYWTCYPYEGINNSGTITFNRSTINVDREESLRYETKGIYNTGTVNLLDNSSLNVGIATHTGQTYIGLFTEGNGTASIDESNILVNGGSTNYGVYTNSNNANTTLLTGNISVEDAQNTYGAYINLGTFTMGHEEGTGIESDLVSTENPRIDSKSPSRGIGVKKINGSFNFYDGYLWASKYTKPETTTNVELNYEVTTYVDEETGYEYALLEFMKNDYQGTTVCKIGETHYRTVQDAINKVEPGEEILLVRSTSEDLFINGDRQVKINLNNHSITTHLVNEGTLNIYNGTLQNFDISVVENNGTLIMGTLDDPVSSISVRIISEDIPLINNGTFIMYDGYLEGNPSIEGSINEIAPYSRIYTKKDSQSEKKYLQSLSEEAIIAGETDLILTVNPNGGIYNDSKEEQSTYLKYQGVYTLGEVTKHACDFAGWEANDASVLSQDDEGYKVTMGVSDVTVTAKWNVSEDAVAKIGNDYFFSLEEAIEAAKDKDIIEVIKDNTEENVLTNTKEIIINLGGHRIEGQIVNNGTLRLLNGTLENTNGAAIINNKLLNLGENDGSVSEDSIKIMGTDVGIEQNGRFNFYDGYIEGDIALNGKVDLVPRGYYLYNQRNTDKNCQRVFLIGNPENAVATTREGGTQFFFSLQDAIDTASITGYEIYIERDFEASYPIEVPEGANIVINLNSSNITTGNNITNNGTLKIHDTAEDLGSITTSRAINNNGELTIEDVTIKQNNSSNNTITSSEGSTLTIKDATIEAKDGYAVDSQGTLILEENYSLKSNKTALSNTGNELTFSTGLIQGITTNKDITVNPGAQIISNSGYNAITLTGAVNATINGGTISAPGKYAIYNDVAGVNVEIKGGTLTGEHGIYCNRGESHYKMDGGSINATNIAIRMQGDLCHFEMNGGTATSSSYGIYTYGYSNEITINDGTVTSTGSIGIRDERYKGNSSNYSKIKLNGGLVEGATHGMEIRYSAVEVSNAELKTNSTNRDHYAYYADDNNTLVLNDGAFLNAPNASGIRSETTMTMNDGARIYAGADSGYGIRGYYFVANLNGGTIEAPGSAAYGILSDGNYMCDLHIDGTEITSGNIGIGLTNTNTNYTRALDMKSGKVSGENYGIYQTGTYTTTIGSIDNEVSTEIPYVTGGLYGIYRTNGTTNFYNGRLRGYNNGFSDDFNNVRTGMDIKTIYEDIDDSIKYLTYTTTNISNNATKNYAKLGDGYAKIKYIGETNSICTENQEWTFGYVGTEDTFNAPCNGKYSLEVWGAQGGGNDPTQNVGNRAGAGGYSYGEIELNTGETLYINVGGQGKVGNYVEGGYNGGGSSGSSGSIGSGSGGGATHIATQSGLLKELSNNKDSVLIVAGGGGGTDDTGNGGYLSGDDGSAGSGGGFAGGAAFINGSRVNRSRYTASATSDGGSGMGGTQNQGYAFGQGESVTYGADTGGAGGGWYGGYVTNNYSGGSGGGSGYIGNSRLSNAVMYGYDIESSRSRWAINFLVEKGKFLQVDDVQFNNLQVAIDYIIDNKDGEGKILVIDNAYINEASEFKTNTKIELDLNGYKLTKTQRFINNGDLKVTDSSTNKGGTIEDTKDDVIQNNYKLEVEDVKLIAHGDYAAISAFQDNGTITTKGNTYLEGGRGILISNKHTLNIENAEIHATKDGIYLRAANSVTNITNVDIKSTDLGFRIEGAHTNLTIDNASIKSKSHAIYTNTNNAVIDINDGNYESTDNYAFYNAYNTGSETYKAHITIDGGTFTSPKHTVWFYGTIFEMNGGEIITTSTSRDSYALVCRDNSVCTINNDSKLTADNASALFIYGTLTLNDGTLKSGGNYGYGTVIYGGTFNMNGGTIETTADNSYGIWSVDYGATLNMTGGEVKSNNIGMYFANGNAKTFNIYGGTVKANNYGIYVENNANVVNIGNKDEELNTETPYIEGRNYGVKKSSGTVNFYSGRLVGIESGYDGTFDILRKGYSIYNDSEIRNPGEDNEQEYVVNYLTEKQGFLQVGDNIYNTIEDAVEAVTDGGTITVINDATIQDASTIDSTKKINFDLNGHTLTITNRIINNADLTILDSTEEKLGTIDSIKDDCIQNNNKLVVDGIKLKASTGNAAIYAKEGTGTVLVKNNAKLEASNGIYISSAQEVTVESATMNVLTSGVTLDTSNAKLKIDDVTITSSDNGIRTYGTSNKVEINNGNITSKNQTIINNGNSTAFIINGGEFTSTNSYAFHDNTSYTSTLTMNDGKFTGASHGVMIYYGTLSMNGGEITTTSTNRDHYALYCNNNSNCRINSRAKVGAEKASGIYQNYGNISINGGTVYTNTNNGYAIRLYNNNLNITGNAKIDAPGSNAYGIFAGDYGVSITVNDGNIQSNNVAVYLSNTNYGKNIIVNKGTITGSNYGIYKATSGTFTVGNKSSEVSTTNPYIEGGLYGLYNTDGTLSIYSGRVKGGTAAYYGSFNNIRSGYEIYEEKESFSNKIASIRTISTENYSADAISNYAKSGNGYAKLTFVKPEELKIPEIADLPATISTEEQPIYSSTLKTLNFEYTGGEQEFVAPQTGTYIFEVWGAQGAYYNESRRGGYGGYSKGEIKLNKGDKVYINVGGQGGAQTGTAGYNGGGNSGSYGGPGGGGGATHIALESGLLSELEASKSSVIIVAGGGAGYASYGCSTSIGGNGGGYIGTPSNLGGTQENGGPSSGQTDGSFGKAGWQSNTSQSTPGAGGGWYGGGTGSNTCVAGGGSGYIGNSLLTNKKMVCYDCDESNETSTKTISVNSSSEEPLADTAKEGEGYAKISYYPAVGFTSENYEYTGEEQEFIAPYDGIYKLETWGAQGGSLPDYNGGYGAYSTGNVYLSKGQKIYINVGGAGIGATSQGQSLQGGYNGGGNVTGNGGVNHMTASGGGATHIALKSGLLANLEDDINSILIVSGGGGGARDQSNHPSAARWGSGGSGGGMNSSGAFSNNDTTTVTQQNTCISTQSSGGPFGQASTVIGNSSGGGGFYSGYSGAESNTECQYLGTGSGGSGFIGNSKLTNKYMTCYECDESDEVGTKTISTNNTSSVALEDTPKEGNGYARVTLIKKQTSTNIEYDYTGSEQEFVAPYDGIYKLETWGAQGGDAKWTGNVTYRGGYGAYSTGTIYLNKGEKLYVNVGGAGNDDCKDSCEGGYNGGGETRGRIDSNSTYNVSVGSGGGATHISRKSGLLSSLENDKDSILIVSGGGGGSLIHRYGDAQNHWQGYGGDAGGYISTTGNIPVTGRSTAPTSATQTEGGTGYNESTIIGNGSFGAGQSGILVPNEGEAAGAGGGYYGGGSSIYTSTSGGSGYIGNSSLDNKYMACYDCEESDGENTKTISITDVSETPKKDNAKQGNGYAKISLVKKQKNTIKEFNYTGDVQAYTIPTTGKYKIELWGAQGNNPETLRILGGKGAYTSGIIELNEGETIYVYVGEHREDRLESFNAGTTGGTGNDSVNGGSVNGYGGGGATDIRLVSGAWNDDNSLASRIMVAGGGGGASNYAYYAEGGVGGTLTGGDGNNGKYPNQGYVNTPPTGGTQISGGLASITNNGHNSYGTGSNGSFGKGGNGNSQWGSGGGGGYYGGGGGAWSDYSVDSGAGGSSYISGYKGAIAITSANDLTPRLDSQGRQCNLDSDDVTCSYHYSDKKFTNGVMKAGNEAMPNYDDSDTMDGNEGNGYAKITFVGYSNTSEEYDYTGSEQTFTAPKSGYYKLETWGAQGGSFKQTQIGGYGAYSTGNVYLEEGETIYINVGGEGENQSDSYDMYSTIGGYNGGGNGGTGSSSYREQSGGSGGGATSIAKESGVLSSLEGKKDKILIVAGGGGGASYAFGGSGGGYIGDSSIQLGLNNNNYPVSVGGTQEDGFAFGQGQNGRNSDNSYWAAGGTGGGGGGYYGGFTYQQVGQYSSGGGAGGSGYIGSESLIEKHMTCYDCDESNLISTKTISTTETSLIPTADKAKEGAGYAKVTLVSTEISANEFDYTGDEQEFIAPKSGYYKLETWGASGGMSLCDGLACENAPGYGAYSTGNVYLNKGEKLYINVGGEGNIGNLTACALGGYNGGGAGTNDSGSCGRASDNEASGGGGGATHIALESGVLSTLENKQSSVLIVAGGGGGASWTYATGNGGGYIGGITSQTNSNAATQSSGYAFGQGQNASGYADSDGVGGAGGGWYGGYANDVVGKSSGAGGSGYIGNSNLEDKHMTCMNCDTSDSESTKTISVDEMSNEPIADKAKLGNGYAKITYLENDTSVATVGFISSYGTLSEKSRDYQIGAQLGTLPEPILDRDDIEFKGWYFENTYATPVTSNFEVTDNINVYAKFEYKANNCSELINTTYTFDYTGNEEIFNPACSGTYKLEVWGAQGGSSTYNNFSNVGGFGGYSSGNIDVVKGEKLYINVGGKGQSVVYTPSNGTIEYNEDIGYNGGGYASYWINNSSYGGGGGATHIALTSGLLSTLENNKSSVLIVAGGGGGSASHVSSPRYSGTGGSGGGYTGGSGTPENTYCYNYGTGGTQNNGGSYVSCSSDGRSGRSSEDTNRPGFGLGANYTNANNNRNYAGGGAGWYGGESGYHAPGGGGSGYTGNERLYDTIMYGYNVEEFATDGLAKVIYLIKVGEFVKNIEKDKTYANLQDAFDEVEDNQTLQLTRNGNVTSDVTIPNKTGITLDLNGYNMSITKSITNNSTLTITNSDSSKTSTITGTNTNTLFTNTNILTVENIELNSSDAFVNNSGATLNINTAKVTSSVKAITNSGTLNINDSNVSSPLAIQNNNVGNTTINNSTIISSNKAINNTGTLTIDKSTINGSTYAIYSDSIKPEVITDSTLTSNDTVLYKYSTSITTITNTDLTGYINVNNSGSTVNITGKTLNGHVYNNGKVTIKNATLSYNLSTYNHVFLIESNGTLNLENSILTSQSNYSSGNDVQGVYNKGTMTSIGNTINAYYNNGNNRSRFVIGIQNNGILTSTNDTFNLSKGDKTTSIYNSNNGTATITNLTSDISNSNNAYGIYDNNGNIDISGSNVTISNSTNAYGIYANEGTVTNTSSNYTITDSTTGYGAYVNIATLGMISGSLDTTVTSNAYGIYVVNGEVTLGTYDGTGTDASDVSITDPSIKAIGSNGVGLAIENGTFNYYDGILIGTTRGKNDNVIATTKEKNYDTVCRTDEEHNYNYCILEFIH